MKRVIIIVLGLMFWFKSEVRAVVPVGSLDLANNTVIAGWAKDDDFGGAIKVRVLIDGIAVTELAASNYRSDVGNHGFNWMHPAFGPGNHVVRVVALGVDSGGKPDNEERDINASGMSYNEPEEYQLTSGDGKVKVIINAKFGGVITKIFDDVNFPGKNLINDSQAGAMFQSAFWLLPKHSQLPVRCAEIGHTGGDAWYDNPTQAGYMADGLAGNPIGIMGINRGIFDPNEFIRFEDDGKTIHLKTRYVRYDYCAQGDTPMNLTSLWNSNFYIEQWLSFSETAKNTLAMKSKISYQGDGFQEIMNGGGLQGIYAFYLPRAAFWKDGQKVLLKRELNNENPIITDKNWAALVGDNNEAGIGMVTAPGGRSDVGAGSFNYGLRGSSGVTSQITDLLYPIGSGPNLATFGILTNVAVRDELNPTTQTPMHHYGFTKDSSFMWSMYFPVGSLDMIKNESEKLLADGSNFGLVPGCKACSGLTKGQGDANCDGKIDLMDFMIWKDEYLSKAGVDADFDCSGTVDLNDFLKWKDGYLAK